jgi:subtilisin family serine protease
MHRVLKQLAGGAALLLAACGGGSDTPSLSASPATQQGSAVIDSAVRRLALPGYVGVLDAHLARQQGPVDVWVSFDAPSVAAYKSARLEAQGEARQARALSAVKETTSAQALRAEARRHRDALRLQQDVAMAHLHGLGARELGRVTVAHNAVAVRVDAAQLGRVAALPGVARVRPVRHYEKSLASVVPYVGSAAVQAVGVDGTGVVVAVVDSGIDYTHRDLGGPGTTAAYLAAYGAAPGDARSTTRDGLFPTAKVVGGHDFVGEQWPQCTDGSDCRSEDDDPIDHDGHGTHVADIIAGRSEDGLHQGIAPGASLVALKACSSVSPSCHGVALLKALDYALDPDGDGDTSDAVDVINLSLGSSYGQQEDDLGHAASNAVKLGVVVVAAAGNGANRPYIVGSPASASGVIAVAQTEGPAASGFPLVVDEPRAIAGTYSNTAAVGWAPIHPEGFAGAVAVVGRGCPAAPGVPEDAYLESPAGKVALIDRGDCSASLKVERAAKAGAKAVLLALVAPGDTAPFTLSGGTRFVPTLVIPQALAELIKAHKDLSVRVHVEGAGVPLLGSLAATSSRGPSVSQSAIKPEIGAPGAALSAVAGTGDGKAPFSGTSAACPVVAGAAALLLQAYPSRTPLQIKAMLMNSAQTEIYTSNLRRPGELAPVTRIGAGELRVDHALRLGAIAHDRQAQAAALSFGYHSVSTAKVLSRRLTLENFSGAARRFSITPVFLHPDDEASGAVTVFVPRSVSLAPHGTLEVDVLLVIDGRKLPDWPLDGGPDNGNGARLDGPEFDGYLKITSAGETLTVPWHVLPRKSAALMALDSHVHAGDSVRLANLGVTPGEFDVFSLVGVSPRAAVDELPQPGGEYAFIDLRALGVRLAQPGILQFAINTFGRRAHPGYPARFTVEVDTNRDGAVDYVVFNVEQGGFASTGSNIVVVQETATGIVSPAFYMDADLQSANVILTVPTALLGMTDSTTFDFTAQVYDNYFSGRMTDRFPKVTYTPDRPRYAVSGVGAGPVAPFSVVRLDLAAAPGGDAASPSQSGLLLMYRRDAGREAEIISMQ